MQLFNSEKTTRVFSLLHIPSAGDVTAPLRNEGLRKTQAAHQPPCSEEMAGSAMQMLRVKTSIEHLIGSIERSSRLVLSMSPAAIQDVEAEKQLVANQRAIESARHAINYL